MSVDPVTGGSVRDLAARVAARNVVVRRVSAPAHPLADSSGRVPVEVFDVPPELLEAIRSHPIRPLPIVGEGPRPASTPPPAPARPVTARLSAEPPRGLHVDVPL